MIIEAKGVEFRLLHYDFFRDNYVWGYIFFLVPKDKFTQELPEGMGFELLLGDDEDDPVWPFFFFPAPEGEPTEELAEHAWPDVCLLGDVPPGPAQKFRNHWLLPELDFDRYQVVAVLARSVPMPDRTCTVEEILQAAADFVTSVLEFCN